ncbi:MAG: DUF6468 domain-containing protein [Magnetovibrio sp.]|nr:DUF6468 domain-containing protein [Magnetovibrio sp.]
MQIGLILDSIIVVLLVLTITYAARLNQRLSQLRGDKKELQALAKTFADATAKAEVGIKSLKISSDELHAEVEKAQALRDDLEYLVERGGRTADQMAASVSTPQKPSSRSNGRSDLVEDEGLLIEEAIRAAKPLANPRPEPHSEPRSKPNMFAAKPALQPNTAPTVSPAVQATRHQSGHPEPDRQMGSGLGGLTPEDRLLDEHLSRSNEGSIGDSDAARELLKALSSVK